MEKQDLIPSQPLVGKPKLIRRIFSFRNILIVLIFALTALTVLAKTYPYFPFDLTITRGIQQFNPPWFHTSMILISDLGDRRVGTIIMAFFVVLAALFNKRKDALMIFTSTIGAGVLSMILKFIVSRPRPDPTLITQIGEFFDPDSFPSGHVLYHMGLYGFLFFLTYSELKRSLLRTAFLGVLFLILILGGISRIYLGAHWFSDTLGSYLLGSIWLCFMVYIYRKLHTNL